MSRVDHWAEIRDRSVGMIGARPYQDYAKEIANLKIQIGRMAGQIFRLKETVLEKDLELAFIKELKPSLSRDIINSVAQEKGLQPQELIGVTRVPKVVSARQEAMWRLHKELGMSYSRIGRLFTRDHSTVMYNVRKHNKKVAG